jgi:phosphoethanolamine N-methyltransferase
MHRLTDKPADFLASFSESDLKYLVDRWEMKVGFCTNGDMKWGNYVATRKG